MPVGAATVTKDKPTYTVTYDANGGTDAPDPRISTVGTGLYLSDEIPTRAGHKVAGWSTNSDNNSISYFPGN